MRWLRCDECGHVFVDGYFTNEANAILFSRTNPSQRPQWGFDHNDRLITARIVASVARLRPDSAAAGSMSVSAMDRR